MNFPLISVIIPSFNHAEYLKKAIGSVKNQSYPNIELIVMDDGSTDHTKEVVAHYQNITYVYQPNQGLSAARNNAIPYSKGEFIVFLDADDWLYPDALRIQLEFIQTDPDLYFVSGGHMKIYVDDNTIIQSGNYDIKEDSFRIILRSHYIAHPAAVMFRRKAFDTFRFDETFKSCQDFDLYLSIARAYKVLHHRHIVSAYRLHTSNMSSNYAFMLEEILLVMKKHLPSLRSKEEFKAYREGKKMFIDLYTKNIYWIKLRSKNSKGTSIEKKVLKKYNFLLYLRYKLNRLLNR